MESHCKRCSVCCVTERYELAVATAVGLAWLRGELELASFGASNVARVMKPSPVATQTAGPELVRTKGSPVSRSKTAL
jgi:hypothetical protein